MSIKENHKSIFSKVVSIQVKSFWHWHKIEANCIISFGWWTVTNYVYAAVPVPDFQSLISLEIWSTRARDLNLTEYDISSLAE